LSGFSSITPSYKQIVANTGLSISSIYKGNRNLLAKDLIIIASITHNNTLRIELTSMHKLPRRDLVKIKAAPSARQSEIVVSESDITPIIGVDGNDFWDEYIRQYQAHRGSVYRRRDKSKLLEIPKLNHSDGKIIGFNYASIMIPVYWEYIHRNPHLMNKFDHSITLFVSKLKDGSLSQFYPQTKFFHDVKRRMEEDDARRRKETT
jgi:hypothetical protein